MFKNYVRGGGCSAPSKVEVDDGGWSVDLQLSSATKTLAPSSLHTSSAAGPLWRDATGPVIIVQIYYYNVRMIMGATNLLVVTKEVKKLNPRFLSDNFFRVPQLIVMTLLVSFGCMQSIIFNVRAVLLVVSNMLYGFSVTRSRRLPTLRDYSVIPISCCS